MKTSFIFNKLFLLTGQAVGAFWAIFLFSLCFFAVHILRLAQIGWEHTQKKEPPPEEKEQPAKAEEKKPPAEQEPIYYIVEKKTRRRQSATYGEPKRISFPPRE